MYTAHINTQNITELLSQHVFHEKSHMLVGSGHHPSERRDNVLVTGEEIYDLIFFN